MICLAYGPKDSEIFNLKRLLLHLHHIAHALSQTTPDHVEEAKSLALQDFEGFVSLHLHALTVGGSWVLDEGQVELRQVSVEVARIVHALLKESEFRDGGHYVEDYYYKKIKNKVSKDLLKSGKIKICFSYTVIGVSIWLTG